MRFGSVCSGIEAASVAWHPLGWKAAWLSEIEPFPSAVLNHHYPDVPNLGDMTLLPDRIASGGVEAPDLFCGGTPCQAFSVAGLRKSLDDARGNLSLVFCEIANAIDKRRTDLGLVPGIIFWENVPGVLSTKDNAFGCFIAGLAGETDPVEPPRGKWPNAGVVLGPQRTVAWRILDAQYFGVAQRRRRVFVVASARDDFDPASVLFEFDGMRRDTAPSREAGQAIAPCVTNGPPFSRTGNERVECEAIIAMAHGQGGAEVAVDRSPTLTCNHEAPIAAYQQPMPFGIGESPDTAHCLRSGASKADKHESTTYVAQPMPINTMVALRHEALGEGTGFGIGDAGDPAYTLTKGHSHAVAQPVGFTRCDHGGDAVVDGTPTMRCGSNYSAHLAVAQPIPFDTTQITSPFNYSKPQAGDPCHPLAAGAHAPAVAQPMVLMDQGGSVMNVNTDGTIGTLRRETHGHEPAVIQPPSMQVRRLTPVECERLQGFPDNYTNIPWRKKGESPDGPRYKALGNSWAVPVVRWIGKRIQEALT